MWRVLEFTLRVKLGNNKQTCFNTFWINESAISLILNVFFTENQLKMGVFGVFDQWNADFVDRKFPWRGSTSDNVAGTTRYVAFLVTPSAYVCFIRLLRWVTVTGATWNICFCVTHADFPSRKNHVTYCLSCFADFLSCKVYATNGFACYVDFLYRMIRAAWQITTSLWSINCSASNYYRKAIPFGRGSDFVYSAGV